jgi:DNA polymerase
MPQPVERAAPPPTHDLGALRAAAAACIACPLHRSATQTVWGEGPPTAGVMLVGEQPGDEEDRTGRPFVGPAGRLLDRALADAGIPRERCWVTNAVKHFKWTARGARRIHARPTSREVAACRPWLEAEVASVAPRVLVCLGATAAAVVGPSVRVTRDRGRFIRSAFAEHTMFDHRPRSCAHDDAARRAEYARFVDDLRIAARGGHRVIRLSGSCDAGVSSGALRARRHLPPARRASTADRDRCLRL